MSRFLAFGRILPGLLALFSPFLALSQSSPGGTAQNQETRCFRAFLDEDWKRWMQDYHEFATVVGFPGQNRRWTDDSAAGYEERLMHLQESLAMMKQIRRDALPPSEQLNYDLYLKNLQAYEESLQYCGVPLGATVNRWIPVTQMDGVRQNPAAVLALMPRQTISDYEDMLTRLESCLSSWSSQWL